MAVLTQIIQQLEQDRDRLRDMINGDVVDTVQLESRVEKSIAGQVEQRVNELVDSELNGDITWDGEKTFNDNVYFMDGVFVNGDNVNQIISDLFNTPTGSTVVKTSTGFGFIKDNLSATTDPVATNDASEGYSVRSRWINTVTNESFICLSSVNGLAVWEQTTLTIDELGSAALADTSDFQVNLSLTGTDATWIQNTQSIITYSGPNSTVTATFLVGNGSGVTDLDAGNLASGTIPAGRFNDTTHGNRSGGDLHSIVTPTTNGFMSATDKAKLDTISANAGVNEATNLGTTYGVATVTITSSTGSDATVNSASITEAGVMSASDKVKLNGIEENAQVNTVNDVNGKTGDVVITPQDVAHVWDVRDSSFTAAENQFYGIDTTLVAITVTLPETPEEYKRIKFFIISENVDVNNITINRNGNTIEGLAEDMAITDAYPRTFVLEFVNNDWKVSA